MPKLALNPGTISSLRASPACTVLLIWDPILNFEPGLDWRKPEEAAPGGHRQNLQALLNKSCFSFSLTPHTSSLKRKCNQGSHFFPKRHSNRPGAKSEQLLTGFSASGNFFAVFKKKRKSEIEIFLVQILTTYSIGGGWEMTSNKNSTQLTIT